MANLPWWIVSVTHGEGCREPIVTTTSKTTKGVVTDDQGRGTDA